ncbi:MAG: hypothetical protein ACR2L2_16695 [Acidobacteriota bacterium]
MGTGRRILLGLVLWTSVLTGLHMWLNFNWVVAFNDWLPPEKRKFNVAYIPVT